MALLIPPLPWLRTHGSSLAGRPIFSDRYFYQRAKIRSFDPFDPRPNNLTFLLDLTSSGTISGISIKHFGEIFSRCSYCRYYCLKDFQTHHDCANTDTPANRIEPWDLGAGFQLAEALMERGCGGLSKGELEEVFAICTGCNRVIMDAYRAWHRCEED